MCSAAQKRGLKKLHHTWSLKKYGRSEKETHLFDTVGVTLNCICKASAGWWWSTANGVGSRGWGGGCWLLHSWLRSWTSPLATSPFNACCWGLNFKPQQNFNLLGFNLFGFNLFNLFIYYFYLCIIVLLFFFFRGWRQGPCWTERGWIWSSNVVTNAVTCIIY